MFWRLCCGNRHLAALLLCSLSTHGQYGCSAADERRPNYPTDPPGSRELYGSALDIVTRHSQVNSVLVESVNHVEQPLA